jgi:hypothetical protein
MAFRYSTKVFHDFLNSVVKADLAAGVINFYSGAQPASPDAAVTGTFLGRATLSGGAWTAGTSTNGLNFGTVVDGTNGAASLDKASAEAWTFVCSVAGTIGYGRFVGNPADAGGVSTTLPRIDFSVGITSGDAQMSKVTYAIGETGVIQSFNIPVTNIS